MKIGIVALHSCALFKNDTSYVYGGAEVQLYLWSQTLAKHGNDVHVFLYAYKDDALPQFPGITFHTVPLKKGSGLIHRWGAFIQLILSLIRNSCDVYIQRNAGYETGVIALLCKIFNRNFVYMISHIIDCNGQYREGSPFRGFLYEYGLRNANMIIAQSNDQKEMLRNHYNIKSDVLRSSYPIEQRLSDNKDNFILWVGRIVEWKRPERIFEISALLPALKLIVIGPQSCNDAYYQLFMESLNSYPNIKYINSVNFDDIDTYFQKAKFLLNTSQYEGFPNTFIQAFKNKTPVLSNNVDPDSAIKNCNLGNVSESCEELARFITRLNTDNALYETIANNCYHYAFENHNIDSNVAIFQSILESL